MRDLVNPISIVQLRRQLPKIAKEAKDGKIFTVIKRSKPIFMIIPIEDDDSNWETLMDLPEAGMKLGHPAHKLLRQMYFSEDD